MCISLEAAAFHCSSGCDRLKIINSLFTDVGSNGKRLNFLKSRERLTLLLINAFLETN